MDPKQRLLLETCYDSLHQAGYDRPLLKGSETAVYVGLCSNDWPLITEHQTPVAAVAATGNSGCSQALHSNRVSYVFGLVGPSMTIDTACSSSLVCIDVACSALKERQCSAACVAGINLCLTPYMFVALSKATMLSPTSRNSTFDVKANGYVRGEGVVAVVLKRLEDAEKDNNPVHAIIAGSCVNQDGASASLTAPYGPAQEKAIRTSLERAQILAHELDYVETHGTGTGLGDGIEFRALKAVFAPKRLESKPLVLGSVKPNIGHLEGAAGLVGLIKAVMTLTKKFAVPIGLLSNVNTGFDLSGFPVVIPKGLDSNYNCNPKPDPILT